MPKLSIITINLNNASGLLRTIESVVNQTFTDYEHIIIDGGSIDNSVEVIKKFVEKITYWVSEPDKGIYNAMNKGILQSKGEYLLMLNSGDILYENDILNKVIRFGLNKDIVYGDVLWIEGENQFVTVFPDLPHFSYFVNSSLCHQATFIKKELHSFAGLYKENYRIVSDWCFFIKALFHYNCSFVHFPIIVSSCIRDGISCDPDIWPQIVKEREEFLAKEFPLILNDYTDGKHLNKDFDKLKELDQKKMNRKLTQQIKREIKRVPFILFVYIRLKKLFG